MKYLINTAVCVALLTVVACQSSSKQDNAKKQGACIPNPNYQGSSYNQRGTYPQQGYGQQDPYSQQGTYPYGLQNQYNNQYNQQPNQYDQYNQPPTYPGSTLNNNTMNQITYYKDIKPLMDRYCVSCHSASGQQSDLSDLSRPGLLPAKGQVIVQRIMLAAAAPGVMPPQGGQQMTVQEKQLFQSWESQSQYALGTAGGMNTYDQYGQTTPYGQDNYYNNYNTTNPCL